MNPADKVQEQLEWRGPNGKQMGHVVLARADAEALLSNEWRAPDGWQLVPREPTIAMLRGLTASWKDPQKEVSIGLWAAGSFREDYQAMLDAAPKTIKEMDSEHR